MPDVLNTRDERPRILVLMASAMNFRDFADCGALALLAERFRVDFVYTDPGVERQLARFGGAQFAHRNPLPRYWLWNCASTLEYLRKYRDLIPGMNTQFFNRKRAATEYWHWSAKLGHMLYRVGAGPVAAPLIRWLLDKTFRFALPIDTAANYAAVVVPTVLRDLASEDVIRLARSRGVPSIAVQGNWDCFNLKEMLAKPDHFLVWGEQSWYFARVLERIPHAALHVIGSQRHDHYFRNRPDRADARRRLGLDPDRVTLLFCGVLSPFDELEALRQLDAAISVGRIPRGVQILYKPHPRATPDKRVEEFDAQHFMHVRMFAFGGKDVWNALDEYPTLLRAVDATLSAYSTMGLETALCGRPTLCLGYHTNPQIPYWSYALEFLHLQSYHFSRWALSCRRPEDLIPSVNELLALAARPDIETIAMESTGYVIYRDARPYPERLCEAIRDVIGAVPLRHGGRQPVAAC